MRQTVGATGTPFTSAELHSLLSHADGMVRSLADWAREYRGEGWRWQITPNEGVAEDYEQRLRERLAELEAISPEPMCGCAGRKHTCERFGGLLITVREV